MKYAKELNQVMQTLPLILQDASINYKLWKKRCNVKSFKGFNCELNTSSNISHASYISPSELLVLLNQECEKVESTFTRCYKHCIHPPRVSCCFWLLHTEKPSTKEEIIDTDTLLTFANMNSKTLYKICKRLQKQLQDPTLMQWLVSIRSAHAYEFLGGHHTAHLTLLHDSSSIIECPICFKNTPRRYVLIYCCGHYACIHCTLCYVRVNSYAGEWYNLLLHARAQRKKCPFCRYDKAFTAVTTA